MAIGSEAIWKLCSMLGVGNKPPRSTTVRATVTEVELDGTVWVNLQGSTQSTPISQSMAKVEPGDEVSVTISGGRATIGGSTSNQAVGGRQVTQTVAPVLRTANRALEDAARAKEAADDAEVDAARAHDAADAAQRSADDAKTAADNAQESANEAQESATAANNNAIRANTSANDALTQLSVVQDVAGTLTWISEHGTFTPTSDSDVVDGRVYFDLINGLYVPVVEPEGDPSEEGWYVLDVTESQTQYVMAHLAVTDMGLWVLPSGMHQVPTTDTQVVDGVTYYRLSDGSYVPVEPQGTENPSQEGWYTMQEPKAADGYKMLLSSDGMYLYDGAGHLVTTYSESIEFDSSRPQRIGNDTTNITFYDSDGDGMPDAIAISGNVTFSQVEAIDAMLSDISANAQSISDSVDALSGDIEEARKVATNWMGYDPASGELTIGVSDPNADLSQVIRNVLTNTRMAYRTGSGEDVAYFGRNEDDGTWGTFLETAHVTNQLRFGNFAWIRRSNNNMTLKWIG